MTRHRAIWLSMVIPAAAVVGCESPGFKERQARRERSTGRVVHRLERLEADRDQKLDKTLKHLGDRHARDIERTHRNRDRLERWPGEELDHWAEREPLIRREIHRQLEGDVENIERTLPRILY